MINLSETWTDKDKEVVCNILAKAEKQMLKFSIKPHHRELGTKRWFYCIEISGLGGEKYIWPEYFEGVDARRVYQSIEWIPQHGAYLNLEEAPDLEPYFDPDTNKVLGLISHVEKARKEQAPKVKAIKELTALLKDESSDCEGENE